MEKKFYLITVYFLLFSKIKSQFYRCGADEMKLKPFEINPTGEEPEKRRLDDQYTSIKIKVDYTPFKRPSGMSSTTFDKVKSIIEETLKEFQKFLLIKHESINLAKYLDNIKESCEVDEVSSDYANFLKTNDVVIFPKFEKKNAGVLASAGFCMTSRKRPIAGSLSINSDLSFNLNNVEMYMKNILLHEITHILMFHPSLFQSLGMMSEQNSVYYVSSPKALEKAKKHFNCHNMNGIPLETQGGEGSAGGHWEARYMVGDYMISTHYNDNLISDITLALFEDTGFYKVNYYSGGLFKFGKNKGCDFLNQKCINNGKILSEEFCGEPTVPKCSSSRLSKGTCRVYDYSGIATIPSQYQYFENPNYGGFMAANFCPISEYDRGNSDYYPENCKYGTSSLSSNYGEKMGDNSFCFVSSLSSSGRESGERAICYEVRCDSSVKRIIVKVGSQEISCPNQGGSVSPSGFSGKLTCPKYTDICAFKGNTICNNLYDCLSKKVESDPDSYEYDPNGEDFTILNGSYKKKNYLTLFIPLVFFGLFL